MADAALSGDPGPLAARLSALFAQSTNPETGKPYTYEAAAAEIAHRAAALPEEARDGRTISASYISYLVSGTKKNPTLRHLESLADLFGVSVSVLIDAEAWARLEQELEAVMLMRDATVRNVAHRVRGLSPSALNAIDQMIAYSRQREGLPADPPPAR